jgi:hypothetical protein
VGMIGWPGTPGGAYSPAWGGDIQLYVWIAIRAGTTFTWGPSDNDNLDAGNVWGAGTVVPEPPEGRLWIDVSCDVTTLDTRIGGRRSDAEITRAEAATASITLADPERIYDPLNPNSPWQYGGRSRLAPGTPVWVWAEVLVNTTTVDTFRIFTGTVDTWQEDWAFHKADRQARVEASDHTATLVNLDWGEQPDQGTGDTVDERIERILDHYGYLGARDLDASTITLQATTLAQSAWELIGRAVDDELGFVWFDREGTLQFRNRDVWRTRPTPVLTIGCPDGHDAVVDADVSASGPMRNLINAAATGGTTQTARSDESIALYGVHGHKRTDLGLQTDTQAGAWAEFLIQVSGFPRATLDIATLKPAFTPAMWPALLDLKLVTDRVHVQWQPPGEPLIESTGRVASVAHTITRHTWEVDLGFAMADIFNRVLHWGRHPNDRLNSAYVWT